MTTTLEASTETHHRYYTPTPIVSKQHAHPNTSLHHPLFTPHSLKMPTSQLHLEGWKRLTTAFPDTGVTNAILGICQFSARIGYEEVRERPVIYPNLAIAQTDALLISTDITLTLEKHRIHKYPRGADLPRHYTASALWLTDRSDGSKRRIHYLSYPPQSSQSINAGILEEYGTITYSSIANAISAVLELEPNWILIERDFESAFRHIPVSPLDSPLLGFHWNESYYAEQFLPFGLHTAPCLFNLFA